MKNITFRRLYYRLPEMGGGFIVDSLIVFGKRAWMGHTRRLDRDEAELKTYRLENTIIQYKYYLRIDLWLVVLQFTWLSKLDENN